MKHQLRNMTLTLVLVAFFAIPTAEAGGFGLHIGSGGFGVSVGVGDWGVYTSGWSDPHWSFNFNSTLNGYGEWVTVAGLGTVWRPWVAVGWQPYTHGRWVHTDYGWTWVAYEPWGYVPHHYGRWALCDFGWVWVPGYAYSPANVVWVRAGGYVGWYARPPRGWSHSARAFRHGYRHGWDDGYRQGWHDARHATYVDWHHLGSDNVSHYSVRHSVVSRHRVIDRAAAPTLSEVRHRGGVAVAETRLSRREISMDGRRMTVARPEGVARSVERHASRTAATALSRAAIERRQPGVRLESANGGGRSGRLDRSRSAAERANGGRTGAAGDAARRQIQPSSRSQPSAARQPIAATGVSSSRARSGRGFTGRSHDVQPNIGSSGRQTRADDRNRSSSQIRQSPKARTDAQQNSASRSRSAHSSAAASTRTMRSSTLRRDLAGSEPRPSEAVRSGTVRSRGAAASSRSASGRASKPSKVESQRARSSSSKNTRAKQGSSPPRIR